MERPYRSGRPSSRFKRNLTFLGIALAVVIVAQAMSIDWRYVRRSWRSVTPLKTEPGVERPPIGQIEPIANRLYLIPGGGANTVVFVTSNGVVVVDPKYPELGAAVVEQVGSVTSKPITHVINTHGHLDHFGGNTSMPGTAQVVVQERAARTIARLRGAADPARFEGRPVVTFKSRLTLFEGEDAIDLYYFGRAHTDGDLFVVFRSAGVMAAGDVFSSKEAPVMNLQWGGSARHYAGTMTHAVAGLAGATRVITGHGPVLPWQDFVTYAEFNRSLLEYVNSARAAGKDPEQARREYVPAPGFADYQLDQLLFTFRDMYKDLTPWWKVW